MLAAPLARQVDELENGRGFFVLRGLPIDRYSDDEISAIDDGIGLQMGVPVRQNPQGDVVGLLCVRKAQAGGVSSLVGVAATDTRILLRHPEILGLYDRPMYFAHLCEPQPSLSPIFSDHQGKLSCRYLRQYIELGHEIRGLPLSRVELEALDLFDAVMHGPDMRLDMMLEPGDLQFANNDAVLHSRNAFVDHHDPALHRKLLRLWLKMPNARVLAPEFPGRNSFPAPHDLKDLGNDLRAP